MNTKSKSDVNLFNLRSQLQAAASKIDLTSARELIEAATMERVARLSIDCDKLDCIGEIVNSLGLSVAVSKSAYRHVLDGGKGWHGSQLVSTDSDTNSYRLLYVAQNASRAALARELDAAGRTDELGELFGVPPCCRRHYVANRTARRKWGGDLFPYILSNSDPEFEYSPWINYGTMYFGSSLLSFVPCSMRCGNAIEYARRSYSLLLALDREISNRFLCFHAKAVLFAGERGISLFNWKSIGSGNIEVTEAIHTSSDTYLAEIIQPGVILKADSNSAGILPSRLPRLTLDNAFLRIFSNLTAQERSYL